MKNIYNILQRVIGFVLLSPAIISVFMFLIQLFKNESIFEGRFTRGIWTGFTDDNYTGPLIRNHGNAGFTSALPFYFGLMAIAGAYLIKDLKK